MDEMILALEKSALEQWSAGDPWGRAEISAQDILYTDPNTAQPVMNLKAYKTYLRHFKGASPHRGSDLIDPKIVMRENAAVLTYQYGTSYETDSVCWNVTTVYFCREGHWRIVHSHWSYVGHRLPDTVEVPVPVQMKPEPYAGVLGEVMALEAVAMERWRKGDPWGFIEISAPEITYFDTGTAHRLNGLNALRAEYAKREGQIHYDVMDFIDPKVQVSGDTAVLFYRFFSTQLNPDGSVSSRIPWNCTEVFAQIDGQWKIIHTHWSFIRGERN